MKIKLKRWGTEQKLLSSLSHWAPLESFIKFYHFSSYWPNSCEFNEVIFVEEIAVGWMTS